MIAANGPTSGPVPITTAASRPGKCGLCATSLEIRTSYQADTEHTQIRPGIRVVDCGRNTASYRSRYWGIGELDMPSSAPYQCMTTSKSQDGPTLEAISPHRHCEVPRAPIKVLSTESYPCLAKWTAFVYLPTHVQPHISLRSAVFTRPTYAC